MSNWVLNTSYTDENKTFKNDIPGVFLYNTTQNGIAFKKNDDFVLLHNSNNFERRPTNFDLTKWHNDNYNTYAFRSVGKIKSVNGPDILPFSAAEKRENKMREKEGKSLLKETKRYNLEISSEQKLEENY